MLVLKVDKRSQTHIYDVDYGFPQVALEIPKSGPHAISQKVAQEKSKVTFCKVAQKFFKKKKLSGLIIMMQIYANCTTDVRFLSIFVQFCPHLKPKNCMSEAGLIDIAISLEAKAYILFASNRKAECK